MSEPTSGDLLRRSPWGAVFGIALLGCALVPSAAWIDAVRVSPPELRADLLLGASLFRTGLAALGLFALASWRLGWWRNGGEGSAAPVAWGLRDPALLAILAVALGLRLHALGQGLWLDEILALVDYYRRPLGEILTTFHSENQHFTISILARISSTIFGESAWAIRLPAALFGVASVWALYLFGRYVADRREALLASALLAVSYHHVWFSQNARGYTAALFCSLLASWLFLRGMSERTPRVWGAYAAVVALGMYSHLTMVYVVMGHFALYLWALARGRLGSWPRSLAPFACGFALSGLLTFTLYAVGIPQFIHSALNEASIIDAWKNPLWTLRETLAGFSPGGATAFVGVAGAALLGVGVVSYARTQPAVVALLFLPALLIAASALALSHHLWPRTFFVVVGFGILLGVRGVIRTAEAAGGALLRLGPEGRTRLGTAAVAAGVCLSAATLPAAYRPKQDYEGARDFVLASRGADDSVIVVGLAAFPYREVFAPDFASADDVGELDVLRARGAMTWVLSSFPTHMTSIHPDIASLLEEDFRLVRRFDGSLGDGEILVHRAED